MNVASVAARVHIAHATRRWRMSGVPRSSRLTEHQSRVGLIPSGEIPHVGRLTELVTAQGLVCLGCNLGCMASRSTIAPLQLVSRLSRSPPGRDSDQLSSRNEESIAYNMFALINFILPPATTTTAPGSSPSISLRLLSSYSLAWIPMLNSPSLSKCGWLNGRG